MTAPKTGPLTRAELQEIWKGATDRTYNEAFIKAGDGRGLEVWGQVFAQFERVSQAIDVTTQAMFIRPSSAATNPPAAGEARATVTLKIARDGLLDRPLVLRAGQFVEEETTDWGPGGGVTVRTGRRYALARDLVFHAGERGPFEVVATAERPGYGYNNPLPGTLRVLSQIGSLFENNRGTVGTEPAPVVLNGVPSRAYMLADNQPDMPVPDHVGQYLYFVNGANRGMTARMLEFVAPQPSAIPPLGSQVDLELLWDVEVNAFAGVFEDGETLAITNGGPVVAYATFLHVRDVVGMPRRLAFVVQNGGSIAIGSTVTGLVSGATATIETVLYATQPIAEAPAGAVTGATWRVLDWALDWQISATNEAQPRGGRSGMLDELGNEREIYRSPGEDDESYRARVAAIADVVSPNAIKRSLNRSMGAYPWCLREVGKSKFRGFFFDGDNEPPSPTPGRDQCDAFDYDTVTITGAYLGSTIRFRENEAVVLEEIAAPNVRMEGRFGRFDSWTPTTFGSGFIRSGVLTVIRKRGKAPSTNLVGWRVRGLVSGAIWLCEEEIENRAELPRRFRTILDIEQFRAFFKVGVSPIRAGEFGIAFDVGRFNAYDAAPYLDFYDGNDTYRSPPVYQNAYNNVDAIRAGGVGFDFYREEDGCVDDNPTGEPLYLINPTTMAGIAGYWETIDGLELDGAERVEAWRDRSGNDLDWIQTSAGDRPLTLPPGSDFPIPGAFTGGADATPRGKTRRRAVIFDGAKFLQFVSRQTFPDGYTLVFFGYPTEIDSGATNPPNPPNTLFGDDDAANQGGFGFGQFFWPGPYYTNQITTMTPPLNVATQVRTGVRLHAAAHDPVTGYMVADGIVDATGPGTYVTAGVNRLGVGAGNVDGFKGIIFAAMLFRRRLTAKELRLLFFRWQYLYL